MSFVERFYHIVRPNPAMLQLLARRPTEGAELLTTPRIWEERGNSHEPIPVEDRTAYFKVVFLASLHDEFLLHAPASTQDSFYDHLRILLGDGSFTPAVFDQWWNVETIEEARQLDDVEAQIGIGSLRMTAVPGFEWAQMRLNRVLEHKKTHLSAPL